MADRYNVDDILEEIKRKKSGAGSMISRQDAGGTAEERPVYSRYGDEADYDAPRSRRGYDDGYDSRYDERPRRRYDSYDSYDEEDRPRRRAAYDEERYDERPSRRSYEDEDCYDRGGRSAGARRYEDRYNDRYDDRYDRRPRDEDPYDYEDRPRRRARRDYDDDLEDPGDRYDRYDERPRRGSYDEDRYARSARRREDRYDDRYEDRYGDREPSRRRVREDEEEPRRSFRFRAEAPDEAAPEPERPRRRREEYESTSEQEEDLTILRERIQDSAPKKPRFADLDEEAAERPAQAEEPQGVSGGTIITSREEILKNFGRGSTMSFSRSFDAAKAQRQSGLTAAVENTPPDAEPPKGDDYTATQMNIDLYAMDEEGNSRAEEERRSRRRRQKEEKGEPVTDEDLDYDQDEVDDFNTPKDANRVYATIRKMKKRFVLRLVATLVLFGLLTYLTISLDNINLPLLTFMLPEENMRAFIGVNLAVLVLAVVLNISTVFGGLKALFTLKPSGDGPVAAAVVVAVLQGIYLTVFPDAVSSDNVGYYFAVVALVLAFNLIGKLFMIGRVERNFRLLAEGGYQRHAFNIISDRNLARELTHNLGLEQPVVGYSQPADFLTNFMHLSFTEDFGENVSRITTPIFLVADLVCAIVVQVLYGDLALSLTVFSAATLLASPLTTTIVGNLPLRRMNKALSEDGSMVAGYTALDRFDDINCFVIRDSELFGPQSITLHGIKTFDQKRIDEAMVDAASIVCKSDCVLNYIFTQMIGGNEKILKKADSIVYEDSMGISAWVDGKRVLIGNRELMMNHNIEIPSKDYEKKFVKDGREVLYLANSGELTAIFVLSYAADPDIVDELGVLADRDIGISVYTTDSNITPQKISELFDFPEDMVEIVPYKLHAQCDRLMAHRDRARAEIVYNGSLASKVRTLSGIITAKTSILLGVILQGVGMLLGYFAVCLLAFTNGSGAGFGTLSFTLLIAYQLFWALITMLLPNLRRY